MAHLIAVDDPADPRLADYLNLRDVALRRHVEAEHGLFLAEGEKVVRRAVQAGYQVRSFLMAARWLEGLDDVLWMAGDVPCYVVSERLAEQVTGFHVHRGALASLCRQELPSVDDVVAGARRLAVLEDMVDHTNVGAVVRCAAALGIDGILLSPRCADPLYRRAVKVAMGAVFSVPWTRLPVWYDALSRLENEGFTTVALTPSDEVDAVGIDAVSDQLADERVALVLGSEGHGVSSRWLSSATVRATIPMAAGIDSLNVAAAAAIAFYTLCRPCVSGASGAETVTAGHPSG